MPHGGKTDAYRAFFENIHRLKESGCPSESGKPWEGMSIPDRVGSILDVGCADGEFLHSLPDSYRKTGVDVSSLPLKRVRCPTVVASVGGLPFRSLAFDLVTCFEVLEHLPQGTFRTALSELQRISRKYIVVTVPNRQNLEQALVRCPQCFCRYHPDWHVRSFEKRTLSPLFRDFRLFRLEECGPFTEDYPGFLNFVCSLYRRDPPAHGVCPQCGFTAFDEGRDVSETVPADPGPTRWNFVKGIASRFRTGKRHYWIRGFYERVNPG